MENEILNMTTHKVNTEGSQGGGEHETETEMWLVKKYIDIYDLLLVATFTFVVFFYCFFVLPSDSYNCCYCTVSFNTIVLAMRKICVCIPQQCMV
jgi:hypothetical protein